MGENKYTHKPHQASYIHCIGIGGIGVSAIARLFLEQGKTVTGSDVSASEVTKSFSGDNVKIYIGPHRANHVGKKVEVIVFSPAVPEDNPERISARERGIVEVSYPEMIGHIMKDLVGITVSGTHGKTTTTALLGSILVSAKLDPTVIVGSFVKDFKGKNERLGKGEFMVVEGDEYKASFLNYKPKIIVLTTIDEDHLDYYRDIQHIKAIFQEYLLRLPPDGIIIANADDPNVLEVVEALHDKYRVVTYGLSRADVTASSIQLGEKKSVFLAHYKGEYERIELPILGTHNISNALAAFACARVIGIPAEVIAKSIKRFKGAWRRFEIIGTFAGRTVIDDYAHHPTEVKALIGALRQSYPDKRVLFVYQPHQEDRFTKLFNSFLSAFDGVTHVYLTEIYQVAGRRGSLDSSKRLADELLKKGVPTTYCKTFADAKKYIVDFSEKGDVIVCVGAGDITDLREQIVSSLRLKK